MTNLKRRNGWALVTSRAGDARHGMVFNTLKSIAYFTVVEWGVVTGEDD